MGDNHTRDTILSIVAECGPMSKTKLYEEYGRRSYIYLSPTDFNKKLADLFCTKKIIFTSGPSTPHELGSESVTVDLDFVALPTNS